MNAIGWVCYLGLGLIVINAFFAAINKNWHSFGGWVVAFLWLMHYLSTK